MAAAFLAEHVLWRIDCCWGCCGRSYRNKGFAMYHPGVQEWAPIFSRLGLDDFTVKRLWIVFNEIDEDGGGTLDNDVRASLAFGEHRRRTHTHT